MSFQLIKTYWRAREMAQKLSTLRSLRVPKLYSQHPHQGAHVACKSRWLNTTNHSLAFGVMWQWVGSGWSDFSTSGRLHVLLSPAAAQRRSTQTSIESPSSQSTRRVVLRGNREWKAVPGPLFWSLTQRCSDQQETSIGLKIELQHSAASKHVKGWWDRGSRSHWRDCRKAGPK